MPSERTYWIILIAGILFFASLIGLVFIPYEIVDYNLGINLISESVGMLFTIVFLSWLFSLRAKREWRAVRDSVYTHIRNHLSSIFYGILSFAENGFSEAQKYLLNIKDEDNGKKYIHTQLRKLKDAKKIALDSKMLSIFLKDRSFLDNFVEMARRLGDIEDKYSRFLSPQLVISLINIQDATRVLEGSFEMNRSFHIPPTNDRKWAAKVESVISDMVSVSFKLLIEEIYKLHEMGIELPYP